MKGTAVIGDDEDDVEEAEKRKWREGG